MPDTTVGTTPETHECPTLTGFTLDEQTWNQEDITVMSQRMNHQSKVVTKSYNNRGVRATVTWQVNDGSTPKVKGNVVSLVFTAGTVKYTVEEVKNRSDETGILLQDVTLEHLDSMTYP
jgi:hypothetical protein